MYCQFILIAIVDNKKAMAFYICKNGYVKEEAQKMSPAGMPCFPGPQPPSLML